MPPGATSNVLVGAKQTGSLCRAARRDEAERYSVQTVHRHECCTNILRPIQACRIQDYRTPKNLMDACCFDPGTLTAAYARVPLLGGTSRSLGLPIVRSRRSDYVEYDAPFVECSCSVGQIRRDGIDISRVDEARLIADREFERAFKHYPELLMRMLMTWHFPVWLNGDPVGHQLAAGH